FGAISLSVFFVSRVVSPMFTQAATTNTFCSQVESIASTYDSKMADRVASAETSQDRRVSQIAATRLKQDTTLAQSRTNQAAQQALANEKLEGKATTQAQK